MARTVAIANQKGGVGKTTTAVNLAAALALEGKRVLLIDLDPQGNAGSGLGYPSIKVQRGVYEVLAGDFTLSQVTLETEIAGLHLIPSGQRLVGAEVELVDVPRREYRLKEALVEIEGRYDFIFIDAPPSLGFLTLNALTAARSVLVPVQCEYYALEGLSSLVGTIEQIRNSINSRLHIEGILRTMFDPRNNLSNDVAAQLIQHFGERVFRTIIPRNVRLAEAPSFGMPAMFHDKDSRGALAYLALAGEMIRRSEGE